MNKQYYYEVRQFKGTKIDMYKDIIMEPTQDLYIHKTGHPSIMVKVRQPYPKIHGWRIESIIFSEMKNDNQLVYHWREITIPFPTDIILTLLPELNLHLCREILDHSSNPSPALRNWLMSDIDQVFMISTKMEQSFGNEHAFMEVKSLYRLRYCDYFQTLSWRAQKWDKLLAISKDEKLKQGDSYAKMLDRAMNFITHIRPLNQFVYQNMFLEKKEPVPSLASRQRRKKLQEQVMKKYHIEHLLD